MKESKLTDLLEEAFVRCRNWKFRWPTGCKLSQTRYGV